MKEEKKKIIGWIIILIGIVVAISIILISSNKDNEMVTFKIKCESQDIYQIFYTMYIDNEYYSKGGMADLEGNVITSETDLTISFAKDYFEGKDISKISFTFSPYGKDDIEEISTTDMLKINAEYGETYNIIFSGDKENGFKAELKDNS